VLHLKICGSGLPYYLRSDGKQHFYEWAVAEDDPLPAIDGLRITGEAFPGRELQASGYSINGTTSCNFEVCYIGFAIYALNIPNSSIFRNLFGFIFSRFTIICVFAYSFCAAVGTPFG